MNQQASTSRTTKVLPFETKDAKFPGHEIVAHKPTWMKSPIKSVVFETRDPAIDMSVETLVHWTRWTEYDRKSVAASRGARICAVILEDGQRIHATTYSTHFDSDPQYLASPMMARGTFRISTLDSRITLLEIAGACDWAYSKRDAAATEKYLSCPWARDNAAYEARNAGRTA